MSERSQRHECTYEKRKLLGFVLCMNGLAIVERAQKHDEHYDVAVLTFFDWPHHFVAWATCSELNEVKRYNHITLKKKKKNLEDKFAGNRA